MTTSHERIVIHKAGSYDALTLECFNSPPPANDEVSIDVTAAGVNYADCVIRMGLYKSANELHGYPITPGFEVAGVVSAIGNNVKDFNVGDRVIAITLFGGYCSQINVTEQQVFHCPDSIPLESAAGIPTVYLTAWFGLHHLAHIEAGESVLVHSGAGGVGLAAIQLIKRAGAKAVAVVGSSHKVETAKAFGADEVIDKSTQDLWPTAKAISPDGYGAIMDPNGYSTLEQSYQHLAPVGKLLIYGFHSMLPKSTVGSRGIPNYFKLAKDWLITPRFNPLEMTADNKSVMAFNLSFLSTRAELLTHAMEDILLGIKQQQLKALPIETFALSEAASAQRRLESAQTVGKLILTT